MNKDKIPNDCEFHARVFNNKPYFTYANIHIDFLNSINTEIDFLVNILHNCNKCRNYYFCDNRCRDFIIEKDLNKKYEQILEDFNIKDIIYMFSKTRSDILFNDLAMSSFFAYCLKENNYKIPKPRPYNKKLYYLLRFKLTNLL